MLQNKACVLIGLIVGLCVFVGAADYRGNLSAGEYELPFGLSFEGDGGYLDMGVDAEDLGIDGNQEKTIEVRVCVNDFQHHEGIFSLGTTGENLRDFSLRAHGGEENRFRVQFWDEDGDIDFTHEAKNK